MCPHRLEAKIPTRQLRCLIRVIAEATELPKTERALYVLASVRRLIGAVAASSGTDCDFAPGSRGAFTAVTLDGFDATSIKAVQAVAVGGSAVHPAARALMNDCPMSSGTILTATRARLVEDRDWYSSPYVEEYMLPARLDHGLLSSLRGSSPTVVHGIGFYRPPGDRPFSESDRALVELFHVECRKLLLPTVHEVTDLQKKQLTPRERDTLKLLLEGHSDKEIAARLSLSPHTVNQYNKSIFRRFGVTSRTALLSKLLRPMR